MIQRCRVCGQCAGGLVSATRSMQPWPEPDCCPACVGKPAEPEDLDRLVAHVLERAARETAGLREKERTGERIGAEFVEMRLR